MSKYDIVEALGKDKVVEKIAKHFNTPNRDDLCQYIYLYMLETMDEEKLIQLYLDGHIKQFISGMIYKQIFSKHTYHYRENVRKLGDSISKETRDGEMYEETLIFEDKPYEDREKEIDDFLETLNDKEKEMLWLLILPTWERTDDINRICNEYNMTKCQYNRLVPMLKLKMAVRFGNARPLYKEPRKGSKHNTRKVEMIDIKTGKTVKIFDNLAAARNELLPKGFTRDALYNCLCGNQKAHRGYTFRYLK